MLIYVIIPVYNRIFETKKVINCLRKQTLIKKLKLIVVDDGSTDETRIWLEKQADIQTIKGNGSLFWGGAINIALKTIFKNCQINEWVVLLNNDIEIKKNYIETLLKTAKSNYPSVIGSIIKKKNNEIVSIGPKIISEKFKIEDLYHQNFISKNLEIIKNVDALSGRGVIYPIKSLLEVKGMRPLFFPHYLADYELSLRVGRKGYNLMISMDAVVYTDEDFELIRHQRKKQNFIFNLFSKKSTSLFYSKILFWWEASNNKERISLPFRIIKFIIYSVLRKLL